MQTSWLTSIRTALAGLTVRGRAFLAAGATAVGCAIVLGQPALTRVGVLVMALPLVTCLVLARGHYQLSLRRSVQPQLVPAGQPAVVRLALRNDGRTPQGALLLEDQVPYVLGSRPRFVLEGVAHGWHREVTYQVRSDVRGHYEIGPMSVRVSDPFGLVELGRSFRSTSELTVTPRTVALPAIALGGTWTGSGDNRPRAFNTGSSEDVTVREYRMGDDLRRVHWRSSARVGELMVRREEQPWQSRATIFLDNRRRAHRGQGIASSFEAAVSAAASIAVHMTRRGFAVRLVTAAGEEPGTGWHAHDVNLDTGPLLQALAVAPLVPLERIDSSWLLETSQHGMVMAVLGAIDGTDLPVLRRMRHHGSSAMALTLDVDAWDPRRQPSSERVDGSPSPADVLTTHGWRAATLGPRDQLATVWEELGRRLDSPAGAGTQR
ncbi:DUF58 domain-containing protein [Nocardioides pacificus]